jgi:hypothetical protein
MKFRTSDHAQAEMNRRGIESTILETVLKTPEQIIETGSNRKVYQSRVEFEGKLYLVRSIVEEDDPAVIVTVYRTSKIEKYWRPS